MEEKKHDWLKYAKTAWTYGAIMTPVSIDIISVDFDRKTARVKTVTQEGNISFDRIFKTESEADLL